MKSILMIRPWADLLGAFNLRVNRLLSLNLEGEGLVSDQHRSPRCKRGRAHLYFGFDLPKCPETLAAQ